MENSINALIVDGQEEIKDLYKEVLQIIFGKKIKVKLAVDGTIGLKYFKRVKPQLVLTGHQMPDVDGLKLIRSIRDQNSNARIVVMSNSEDNDIKEMKQSGANVCIPKKNGITPLMDYLENMRKDL